MDIFARRSWMWAEACALLDEAERKHRRFFNLLGAPATHPVWEPPADIFTDGAEIHVVIALPGARAEEVTLQFTSAGLQIDATVPAAFSSQSARVLRLEIPYGRMQRRIDLPPGRYAVLERMLDRGCLRLRLAKEVS